MSRSGQLILLGTTWTLVSVYATAQLSINAPLGGTEAGLLTLSLLPSVVLFMSGALTRSPLARWTGVVLALALPMAWLSHLALGAGTFVDLPALSVASMGALLGCVVADYGLTLANASRGMSEDSVLRMQLEAAARPVLDPPGLGSLIPCDSGALPTS